MALPEDDVEEVDPEPALARILDHEHDAIVVGPGSAAGARHRRARPLAAGRRRRDRRGPDRARRGGAPLDGDDGPLVGGRAPAGGPDPARRGVRPAPRGQRRRGARGRRPVGRRRGPPGGGHAMPPRRGARWSSSRVPARSSPRRMAARPSHRSRTRPSPPAGPATCWRGRSARCSPRASTRSTRPASGSTSTAWPATPVRERFGDAGLLAADLPDGLAVARKRLAAIAERQERRQAAGVHPRHVVGAAGRRGGSAVERIARRAALSRAAA